MHYERVRQTGRLGSAEPRWRPAPVDHRGPWTGCWEWSGNTSESGYGSLTIGGQRLLTHREVYVAIFGPIPDDVVVCHRCDNPPCFRPDHLFIGSRGDNAADMVTKGRQARGERHSQARLTEADVRAIRTRHPAEGTNRLAVAYGVKPPTISDIVHDRTWAWLK